MKKSTLQELFNKEIVVTHSNLHVFNLNAFTASTEILPDGSSITKLNFSTNDNPIAIVEIPTDIFQHWIILCGISIID